MKLESNGALRSVMDLYGSGDSPLDRLGLEDPAALAALLKALEDGFEIKTAPAPTEYYDEVRDRQAAEAYYASVELGSDPKKAFRTLSEHLEETHRRRLSYREARREHLYPNVDLHPDGQLRGVYTGIPFHSSQAILEDLMADFLHGDEQPALRDGDPKLAAMLAGIAEAAQFQPRFNTEHAVPQSWFDRGLPMRADLHGLFTAEMGCNSRRSNLPFGDNGGAKDAECGLRDAEVFEPARNKGAVARATLYFLMRYPGLVSTDEMPRSSLETILKWHEREPPSRWEKHRNQEIANEEVQGNRNPLIDHPEWAKKIDFTQGLAGSGRRR